MLAAQILEVLNAAATERVGGKSRSERADPSRKHTLVTCACAAALAGLDTLARKYQGQHRTQAPSILQSTAISNYGSEYPAALYWWTSTVHTAKAAWVVVAAKQVRAWPVSTPVGSEGYISYSLLRTEA